MLIYAAGASTHQGIDFADKCHELGIPKLYSALNERKFIDNYKYSWLFVDSGAHSWTKHNINKLGLAAHKSPPPVRPHAEFYPTYIENHKDKNWLFVELDCYHEDDLGIDYVNGMYKEINSIKGNFKFIRVYHPYIDRFNEPLATLKKWISEGQDYIGISKDSAHLFDQIFNLTRETIKFHGFACTGRTLLEKYPFYSVDSTTALVVPMSCECIPVSYGRFLSKKEILKTRDVRYLIFRDPVERITRALQLQKEAQDLYTRLWVERGVSWNNQ